MAQANAGGGATSCIKAARREIEKALRADRLTYRAERELRSALREVGERRGDPARRLDRVVPFVSQRVAGHLAVAVGHLRRAGR